jgi:hypothetical protein
MDRVKIEVWVTRSAAERLAVLAAERGVSRSAYARGLLSGEPVPAAAALVVVDKPKPQAVAPTAARTPSAVSPQRDGCARCGCAVTRDAIRWGTCAGCGHPRLDH